MRENRMKKLIIFIAAAIAALIICLAVTGENIKYDNPGVRYIGAQSRVVSADYGKTVCRLCFESTADKPLEFCVYGIYNDERLIGLDSAGRLKSCTINSRETRSFEFEFNGKTGRLPDDVVIIGEYK